ncbi:MAG: hypothetical protein E6I87_01290 [Chloroflexi bacterium]|nr:MAG: hypothetical protein E6I87_01290 [Chloroflexota bacterium]
MTDTTRVEPVRRRGGFGFALALIGIGLAALLANLGYFSFSWTAILALWPLLLIIAGIDLVLAHRAPMAALAIDVVVIAAGLVILATRPFGGGIPSAFPFVNFGGNDCPSGTSQASVSVPKTASTPITLHITGGAATYTVTGGATDLIDATSDDPNLYVRTSGSDIRLTQCDNNGRFGGQRNIRVQVADDVPVSLDLTGGAGTFTLDLLTTKLTELRSTNGAATMEIDLPKPTGDVPVRLTGGASTINIVLGGAEASVDVTGGLTNLNAPGGAGGGTIAGRQHWESTGYSGAHDRYTITVTGGASTITVR